MNKIIKSIKWCGEIIGMIVNSIILMIIYVIGVGITAIIGKVCRKKFIDTQLSKESDTYWKDIDSKQKSMKSYYKQF